jgi:alkyl hydroperoxide reductase subunit AhpC
MTLNLGDLAPDFTARTTDGEIRFHDWLGDSWGVLFSHPADFTPVCTTELGAVARLHDQFAARDTKVAAVSVDPAESHRAWAADIEETQGAKVTFPLIADPDRRVATLYGMIHPRHDDSATVRSVFIIGPDKTVKLTLTYPASTGRHFGEILRVLDSLQLTAAHQLATPADWQPGQDVIITPAVSHEEAARRFPDHRQIKAWVTSGRRRRHCAAICEHRAMAEIAVTLEPSGDAYVSLVVGAPPEVRDSVALEALDEVDTIPALDRLVLDFDHYGRLVGLRVTGSVDSILAPSLLESARRTT